MSFYLITNEEQLDEIINENTNKLVIVLYSSQNEKLFDKDVITKTKQIKKYFNQIKEVYHNIIFLYVNLSNYGFKKNIYTNNITKDVIPRVSFYYNLSRLANIDNIDYLEDINNVITQLKNKIESKKSSIIIEDQPIQEQIQEKLVDNTSINNENNKENNEIKKVADDEVDKQLDVQRKLEEIERLKQQYLILELQKIKKMKEEQEGFQTSESDSE